MTFVELVVILLMVLPYVLRYMTPPLVAASRASSGVMCMSRTASAMQNAIEVV